MYKKAKNKKLKQKLSEFRDVLVTARKLMGYVYSKSPKYFVLMFLGLILISFLPFVGTWFNSRVIDQLIIVAGNPDASYEMLLRFVALSITVIFIQNINSGLFNYFEMNLWFDVGRKMSYDITKKFAELDLEYYEDPKKMDLLNKVKDNYGHMPQEFMDQIMWSLNSLIIVVSAISIIIFFKPVFILVLLVTTFPLILINVVFGRRQYGIWDAKGEVKRDYYRTRWDLMEDDILKEVKIFNIKDYLLSRMDNLYYSFQKDVIKNERKRSFSIIAAEVLNVIGYTFVIISTAFAVITGQISVGTFNFYISTATRLQTSLADLFRRISKLYESGLYVKDIFTLFEMENVVVNGKRKLPVTDKSPTIEFKNVYFSYPKSKESVFRNFNLTIKSGEHLAIVGENGAGKTTLIKLLMRFYDVTKGQILINGYDIKDLDYASWYQNVGVLFQDFNFYHFTAQENIGVGKINKMHDLEGIIEAAKKSGAHGFISKYKKKYKTPMSKEFKDGINPSSGQMQKIALARAFFKNAPLLVLDEPTSAIDPKAEFKIFENLFEFAKNKSVVIISHRFSTVRTADRIIVLNDGKIIEDGSHEELIKADGVYKEAFDLQKKGYT